MFSDVLTLTEKKKKERRESVNYSFESTFSSEERAVSNKTRTFTFVSPTFTHQKKASFNHCSISFEAVTVSVI